MQNVLIILNWCLCDFLLLKHINEVHALDLDLFIYSNVDWFFFMCKMFLSFSTDVYVIFLLLKHIDEVYTLHLHLSLLMLTYFLCGKYSRISILVLIIYWCWLFFMCKMFLSFSTDVYVIFCYWNISMKCTHFILICHLLMLTFFFVCKMFLSFSTDVYVIFCVLKHIDEVYTLHLHLSLTDVDIDFLWKIF